MGERAIIGACIVFVASLWVWAAVMVYGAVVLNG